MKQALHTIVGTKAILCPRRRCVREYSRMLDASLNTSIEQLLRCANNGIFL